MTKNRILFVLFLLFVMSKFAVEAHEQKARDLNTEASKLFPKATSDKKVAAKALRLYDEAIKADSLFPQSYWNKVTLLRVTGKCRSALRVLDKLSTVRPDLIGVSSFGGYILERQGRSKDAMKRYMIDIVKCDSIVKASNDTSTISAQLTRATLFLFVKGKNRGIAEYERLAQMFPSNKFVIAQRNTFYEFDRNEYLRDICK